MMRFALTATVCSMLLSTSALADRDDLVKEIEVTMDLAAVTNPAAAERFASTADDLKNALAVRLVDRLGETGMSITVDVSEVELSNSFSEIIGAADTRLVGDVTVSSTDNSLMNKYILSVDVNQARVFFPADADTVNLTANSDVFYVAMIDAFADGVVKRLDE